MLVPLRARAAGTIAAPVAQKQEKTLKKAMKHAASRRAAFGNPLWERLARRLAQPAEALVEVRDGLDAAEIVLERDVLVGRVRVFIGQAEAEQDARHLEGVVHLRDERNRATLADEHRAPAETLLERVVRDLEERVSVRRHPGLARAQQGKLARYGLGQQLADVLFHGARDLVRILVRHQARG